jgi:hypothetical protein
MSQGELEVERILLTLPDFFQRLKTHTNPSDESTTKTALLLCSRNGLFFKLFCALAKLKKRLLTLYVRLWEWRSSALDGRIFFKHCIGAGGGGEC